MEVTAFEYTCNGCEKSVIAKHDEDVLGISGDVFEVSKGGGHSATFWACSRKCVGKAVANALDSLER